MATLGDFAKTSASTHALQPKFCDTGCDTKCDTFASLEPKKFSLFNISDGSCGRSERTSLKKIYLISFTFWLAHPITRP
jgi:hypothetical protein